MLSQFGFVGVFVLIALFFGLAPLIIAFFLRPKKPSARKTSTYECGLEPRGDAWVQFRVQYYVFGLAFIVFDVEAALLLPWAVAYQALDLYAVVEAIVFVLILLGGLVYVWRKGALEWM